MEKEEKKFQSTKDVRAKNLESLQEICNHLKEQGDYILIGPNKEKFGNRYHEAKLNGHAKSSNLRFTKFSFDNKKCELTITFCFVAGGDSTNRIFNMNDFDEKMLTRIRTATREWIYDGVLA